MHHYPRLRPRLRRLGVVHDKQRSSWQRNYVSKRRVEENKTQLEKIKKGSMHRS